VGILIRGQREGERGKGPTYNGREGKGEGLLLRGGAERREGWDGKGREFSPTSR